MYVRGEDNCVADALSRLPATFANTEDKTTITAGNAYAHCTEDEEDVMIASVFDSSDCSPLRGAEALVGKAP